MTWEDAFFLYYAGVFITAAGCSKHRLQRFWRCTLLWPLFWLYLVVFSLIVIINSGSCKKS